MAFITDAATAIPNLSNTKVNGETAISSDNNLESVYGINKPIAKIAKM